MFVTHLESAWDGTRFEKGKVWGTHAGRPLWVRYDLEAIRRAVRREELVSRPATLWRYRELLPHPADVEPVSLGETMTPLLDCPRLAKQLDVGRLWIKDESRLPTGSFKARGMALAVTMARALGIRRLAAPTAGNAGGALAAYAARARMEAFVFMPGDTPAINQLECFLAGARVFLVNGLITDCGRIVRDGVGPVGWFDLSTLKEPYRLEGKKTMGLELAEQLGWRLPDAIFYPTGGGTGLVGMWKAFAELGQLGWLDEAKWPRLYSCQSDGCAPIVRAFEAGERLAAPWENAHTVASGLRVPAAVGDFMMLDAIRASRGAAVAAREDRLVEWMRRATRAEGVSICPETAACFDCLASLRERGTIRADEEVVVFNTAGAQKYPEAVTLDLPRIDKDQPIDYAALASGS